MADLFLELRPGERREALVVAAAASGRPLHLLDKDVWVVWILDVLFRAPFASPDLVGVDSEPLPPNRSQEKRWTKEIRSRLPLWIRKEVVPLITRALSEQKLSAGISTHDEKIFIEYEPLAKGSGYTRPTVMLEFGARSTGEPCEVRPVRCDAADHLPGVAFPSTNPRVMSPARTFWEKATAIHVYCAQGEFRGGDRFARHWHDITRLDRAGFVEAAIANRVIAQAVARHKAIFFAEKNPDGDAIDYEAAVSGKLRLVPRDEALEVLSLDYSRMVDDGLLLDEAEPFEELLDHCREVQERVNRGTSHHT